MVHPPPHTERRNVTGHSHRSWSPGTLVVATQRLRAAASATLLWTLTCAIACEVPVPERCEFDDQDAACRDTAPAFSAQEAGAHDAGGDDSVGDEPDVPARVDSGAGSDASGDSGSSYPDAHDASDAASSDGSASAGQDTSTTRPDCDDKNPCTDDSSKAGTGTCVHQANNASCDDGNECTHLGNCVGGSCQQGSPLSTNPDCKDDGNECTHDSCFQGNCLHGALTNDICNADDNPCTVSRCDAKGVCQHTSQPGLACPDDGDPCTISACVGTKCVQQSSAGACDDGDACTDADSCKTGKCEGVAVQCHDGGACYHVGCNPATGCEHNTTGKHGDSCDDGSSCTTDDKCKYGTCKGTLGEGCPAWKECTIYSCNAGKCEAKPATGAACTDDGEVCTANVCKDGKCTHPPAHDGKVCNDGKPCGFGKCTKGVCASTSVGGACDDGDECTGGDSCAAGHCFGGKKIQLCIEDKNPCTKDDCDPKGKCQNTPLNGVPCPGLSSACPIGKCTAGFCLADTSKTCTDKISVSSFCGKVDVKGTCIAYGECGNLQPVSWIPASECPSGKAVKCLLGHVCWHQ